MTSNKKLFKTTFVLLFCFSFLFSDFSEEENRIKSYFCSPDISTLNISDWKNPTYDDYWLIQNHLNNKLKTILANSSSSKCFNKNLESWITYRLGRTKLIDSRHNLPSVKVVYFNNNPEKKDKCVICYASYPVSAKSKRDYTKGISWIIKSLRTFNFDGHLIYCIGGWPNLKKDRLKFADVPYAFKPFFFEEARDLGYKKILWLDAASIPIKSLDPIFNFMEKKGCCFFGEKRFLSKQEFNDRRYIIRSLGFKEKPRYRTILTQVVGLDLTNKKASHLLNLWIQAAKKKVPFLEPSGDQFSFTLLIHELNLLKGQLPSYYYIDGTPPKFRHPKKHPKGIIYHQYEFLNPKAKIPRNIFLSKK